MELKKEKYVYYHCTGNKGKCPGKYTREEIVDRQFMESLRRIHLENDVIDCIVSVMNSSTAGAREQRETQIKALVAQKQKLESRRLLDPVC